MADVQAFTLWSSTPVNNKPAGTDVIGAGLDDNMREIQAQAASWRDGTAYGILTINSAAGANSITGTTSPSPALAANQKFLLQPAATNSAGVSIALNGGAFKALTKQSSGGQVACAPGDLLPTNQYLLEHDGTEFVLINSRPHSQGANIATAGTLNLDTATGDYIHLTGAVTITAATLAVGEFRTTVTDSTPLFKNSASLILPGGADITAAAGDIQLWRGEASSVVRCLVFTRVSANPGQSFYPKGYLFGGILSNNAGDATNSIDITAGQAKDSTGSADITWSALTAKSLNAAWVAGSSQGMRDTGSIANGTWHIYAIRKDADGTGDILASLSASTPTMPAGYTFFRCIGRILRESAALVAFKQVGNTFWRAGSTDYSSTAGRSIALLTLAVPTGVEVQPLLSLQFQMNGAGGDIVIQLAPGANSAFSYNASSINLATHRATDDVVGPATNTSAQVYLAVIVSSGSINNAALITHGWIDRRGMDS